MADKYYYKIVNDYTSLIDFYVSIDVPVQDDKVCEILNLNGCHAVGVTKEEFERETMDE